MITMDENALLALREKLVAMNYSGTPTRDTFYTRRAI
jgi:hypothetical protein